MSGKKKEKKFSGFVNNPVDFPLLIVIFLLLAIGLVMVLSASSPSALAQSGNSYEYFERQLIFAVLGIILMMVISKVDYRFYQKYYKLGWFISAILLVLVIITGTEAKGATRWLYITDSIGFQPSEIVKLAMIIFYAGILTKNRNDLKEFRKGFIKHFVILAPIAALVYVQPHLSATLVICAVCAIMILIAGSKVSHFIITGIIVGVPGLIYAITSADYRQARFTTFLDPWSDPTGDGYQVIQSLYAIGSGGLFGAGLGESKQKYSYIPEPQNDFIFAILAEELGFIGCTAVLLLFAIFVWRGIVIAIKAPDMFGSLIAIGITMLVGIQAIINIAVVTSSIPATGIQLPFFSYGGTALVILLAGMGVLLNISRASAKKAQ